MRETLDEMKYGKKKILGSPPRMRETLRSCVGGFVDKRITPAYAGNTMIFADKKHNHVGSPPRMRETQETKNAALAACRITPAYAGNTPEAITALMISRDHPRVCGKHNINFIK